jgi:formylglycine-generating enzyme required for sulfatase activity
MRHPPAHRTIREILQLSASLRCTFEAMMKEQTAFQKILESPRIIPLLMGFIVCVVTASALGTGLWYKFGRRVENDPMRAIIPQPSDQPPPIQPPAPTGGAPSAANPAIKAEAPSAVPAPAGELLVSGGVIELGGPEFKTPVRKASVESFAIAETEITNEQYYEFVQASNHRPPKDWENGKYPPGTAKFPVTNVTWRDAADYCEWLSKKLGATVRLPSEAEWELAARGANNAQYPWGDKWNDAAAAAAKKVNGKEVLGKVAAVKSYPEGRSPVGAYDMAGNVWEWTSETPSGTDGKPRADRDGGAYKVVKGGSAEEPISLVSARSRLEVPETASDSKIGFRYVIVRTAPSAATETNRAP